MGRPYNLGSTVGMVSNPYPKPKDIQARNTTCELCDRVVMTKDWTAHKNSKRHRLAEEAFRTKENKPTTTTNGETRFDNNGFGGESNGFEAPSAEPGWGNGNDAGWGNGNGTDGTFDNAPSGGGYASRNTASGHHSGGGGGGGGTCYGCGQEGHMKRDCPSSGNGGQRGCFVCGDPGHRKAECPNPGQSGGGRACFNCGETGHNKVDCPNPRQGGGGGGGRPCFNCGQTGHNKAECPNERVITCRNCDAVGHISKECDKPRDYSRVKCNNCGNMGHTVKRCPEPVQEQSNDYGGNGGGYDNITSGEATGGWADAGDNGGNAGAGGWEDAGIQENSAGW